MHGRWVGQGSAARGNSRRTIGEPAAPSGAPESMRSVVSQGPAPCAGGQKPHQVRDAGPAGRASTMAPIHARPRGGVRRSVDRSVRLSARRAQQDPQSRASGSHRAARVSEGGWEYAGRARLDAPRATGERGDILGRRSDGLAANRWRRIPGSRGHGSARAGPRDRDRRRHPPQVRGAGFAKLVLQAVSGSCLGWLGPLEVTFGWVRPSP